MGNIAKTTLQQVLDGILERGLVANDPATGVLALTEKGEEWWRRAMQEIPVARVRPTIMNVYACMENPPSLGYRADERCGRCVGCANYHKAQAEPVELALTEQEVADIQHILGLEDE